MDRLGYIEVSRAVHFGDGREVVGAMRRYQRHLCFALGLQGLACASDQSPATVVGGAGASAQATAGSGGAAAAVSGAGPSAGGSAAAYSTMAGAGAGGAAAGGAAQSGAGSGGADSGAPSLPARVLLYHFSTLDIPTVPAQLTFLKSQLMTWGFDSDDSVDPTQITDQNLERYAAVAMINTCFEPFGQGQPDTPQSQVLQRFLNRGGGLFGTHCASVTFQSANPPVLYNQLLGGRGGNGFFEGMNACRTVAAHAATSQLAATFSFNGNLDNTDYLAPDTTVLVKCKWQTTNSQDVAVSWYRNEGLGRIFYTDFAKVDADLKDAVLGTDHILPGLAWVLRVAEP
jgi:hypothetical protein